MSVFEKYEMLVRSTVLKELDRIRAVCFNRNATELSSLNGELSQAESVDFSLLIYNHLNCLDYPDHKDSYGLPNFMKDKNLEPALRLMHIFTAFPKLTFDAYYEIVQKGDGREEFGRILTAVRDKIYQADPFAFSTSAKLFENDIYNRCGIFDIFEGLCNRHKLILDSPERLSNHLRLEMIAFLSEGVFSCALLFKEEFSEIPSDNNEPSSEILVPLFDYHVLKRGDDLFSNLIVSLTDRAPFEVLDELERKIKAHYFPNCDSVLSDLCLLKADFKSYIVNGSLKSIKFLD